MLLKRRHGGATNSLCLCRLQLPDPPTGMQRLRRQAQKFEDGGQPTHRADGVDKHNGAACGGTAEAGGR